MTIFEELGITYEEKDGLFYPSISMETENMNVGKYGLLWMEYIHMWQLKVAKAMIHCHYQNILLFY